MSARVLAICSATVALGASAAGQAENAARVAGSARTGPAAPAGEPARRDRLEPGPFAVGFTSELLLDPSRRYQTTFPDGTKYADEPGPRPILVQSWYPAQDDGAERMRHRAYFDLASDDERVDRFAVALAAYARDVLVNQCLGTAETALAAGDRVLLEAMLDTPTGCRRDAAPAEGRFPLVIYHAGYGSSFEDNALLCEHLASHGYVVVGSAFQKADGSSFNVDAHEGTAQDVDFLIAQVRARAEVDAERVAMVGHSGGAHATLRQQARPASALDALVSLDTTQDYYSTLDPRWSDVTEPLAAHPERMAVPILFAAEPHACFQLADTLAAAERWYFTTSLDHDEFISQGVVAAEVAARRARADATRAAHARAVRERYSALCRFVRAFLDAHLKQERADLDRLTRELGATPLSPAPHVVHVGKGVAAPPAYRLDAGVPPTPRQLRPLLAEHGAAAVAALLRQWASPQTAATIAHQVCGFALVDELAELGREDDARTIGAAYVAIVPGFLDTFSSIAALFARLGRDEFAQRCWRRLLLLDPQNEVARRELEDGP